VRRSWQEFLVAVQPASALTVSPILAANGFAPLLFVGADGELLQAARAECLAAENPNDHPDSAG
jgi:hypothetical protein